MKSIAIVFFAVVAAASASVIAPAFTAYSTPLAAAYATPIVAPLASPSIAAYAAPYATVGGLAEDTVVAGPSGTIATSKRTGAPVIAAGYAALPAAYSGLYW